MSSSTTNQSTSVQASDRLSDAITQATMLCNIEGEQSEVCALAQAYVDAVRSEEMTEGVELKPSC